MSSLTTAPPFSAAAPVTEVIHGVSVTDPYRWLEDSNSPETRRWIEQQTQYARAYLDGIPGRDVVRKRIREFLAVETYDSLQMVGNRYIFRKRLPDQEQPCIYMREGAHGPDQLLLDPSHSGTGKYTAMKPVRVSPDGRLLLYEIKEGGERTGTFALFDIEGRRTLPDVLPRGYFAGSHLPPTAEVSITSMKPSEASRRLYRAAYQHVLGAPFTEDKEVFFAGEGENLRLGVIGDTTRLGFLVYHFLEKTRTDFYLKTFDSHDEPQRIFADADYSFGPRLVPGRILAITDRDAPNLRIVELRSRGNQDFEWVDVVPEEPSRIHQWVVARDRILVSYIRQAETRVFVFDLDGNKTDEWPVRPGGRTVRFVGASPDKDEIILESDSFTGPPATLLCSLHTNSFALWAKKQIPFDSQNFGHKQVWYSSKDGTRIPMFLMGRRDVLAEGCHPAIMTSYGGYGVSMTPRFSVFVAFLVEQGCLFALPNIRGGSEFGAEWHNAAKRRNRQTAYDDFLAAAQSLIATGQNICRQARHLRRLQFRIARGAALTQRPDLFRAVVCMVPMLDMLRYHLFDEAHIWRDEFGTADDPGDFQVLAGYSPYHQVRDGIAYPAVLFVSGDRDQNCNPLHARKMTARLQAANASGYPILLDYSKFRGHSPVLPLTERIEALTDRMAFLCDQLRLSPQQRGA